MPASQYDDGNFYLETASGDRVFLDNSHFGGYVRPVINGQYDVYWELETPGATVPFNLRSKLASGVSVAGGTLDIDITSHAVLGNFTLNGLAFPASAQHTGQILLRDQNTGTLNVLAQTQEGHTNMR